MPTMANPWKHPQSGIYYFRVAVPEDLRSTIGRREVKKSLKTRNYAEAKLLFSAEYTDTQQMFEQHRTKAQVTSRDIQVLADRWLTKAVEEVEANDNFSDYVSYSPSRGGDDLTDELIGALEAGYFLQEPIVGELASELVHENGLFIVKGSERYRELVRVLCQRKIQFQVICLKRSSGNWGPVPEEHTRLSDQPLSVEGSEPVGVRVGNFKSLTEVVEDYIKYKVARDDWVYKSEQDARVILGLLVDSFGAKTDPNTITREQFREFVNLLGCIPQRYNLNKAFHGLNMQDVITLGESLGMPVLSQSTVKKKFAFVKSLFRFASQEEWVDKNRTEGLTIKVDPDSLRKRITFTVNEIKAIFAATKDSTRPSDYWVPRIGLTTGMRENEILQIHAEDVRQHKGVWYFDINREFDVEASAKKKTKSGYGVRQVPIPAVLIQAGFLDFRESVEGGRLFTCVQLGSDGTYSHTYGRRFNRIVDSLGLKPPKGVLKMKDFHSLRHAFRANAREHEIPKEMADMIGGWKTLEGQNAGDSYGREFTVFLSRLKKYVDCIDYEGVEF
jgi:integrase